MGRRDITDEILIRRMRIDDIDAVCGIARETPQLQTRDDTYRFYTNSDLEAAISSDAHVCFVASHQGKIVGFGISFLDKALKDIYISDLAIQDDYRHLGLGTKMLNAALSVAKQYNIAFSWAIVQTDNLPVQHFLASHGFSQGKTFYCYIKDEEDAHDAGLAV